MFVKNVVLTHMGVENYVTCSFCKKKEQDDIELFFWRCHNIKVFWEPLQIMVNNECSNALSELKYCSFGAQHLT